MSDSDLAVFRDEYLPHVEASDLYKKWARDNPGELARWIPYRDAILAGQQPAEPAMASAFGSTLVDAGQLAKQAAPAPPPPDPDPEPDQPDPRLYAPPVLDRPKILHVPASQTVVNLDKSSRDWILEFDWIERPKAVLIYGWDGQNFIGNNYEGKIAANLGGSAYSRGGPRVRSSDGIGPAHAYFSKGLIGGAFVADNVAVDAGTKTVVTVAEYRMECAADTTGQPFYDPAGEHIDQLQTQGKIGRLRLSVCTLNLSDQTNPGDAGGKGLMLHKETGGPFAAELRYVNFVGRGRNGATIFQNTPDIQIIIGEGVYADLAKVTSPGYGWGPSSFYPNTWKSSGTAPHRVATFVAPGWSGQIFEGRPPGGDYVTRAVKP